MSRGAEHCGVSQSAASQHVQEVERRLGVILLDRGKRPLELTQAGRIYCDFCRDVLRRQEVLSLSLESLKGEVEGTVRVVSIYSAGLSEMSRLGAEFTAKYPTAALHVEYMRPTSDWSAIRNPAARSPPSRGARRRCRWRCRPTTHSLLARRCIWRTSTATPSSASMKTCASAASWIASCARRGSRSTS